MLQLQDNGVNLGTVPFLFHLGAIQLTNQDFTNSLLITIRDTNSALPYPATIPVSGLSGTVTKVTVTLRGLTHSFPDDIDVMLVGPAGQKLMLMSSTGGANSVTNLTLTFDDAASATLPDNGRINSGAFRPTNIDTNTDAFPAPAPAGPFGTGLSVFNNTNPNGNWLLYVQDDGPADTGTISQGWSISHLNFQ